MAATVKMGYDRMGGVPIDFAVTEGTGSLNPDPATTGEPDGIAYTILTPSSGGWITVTADATVDGRPLHAAVEVYVYDCQNPPDEWPMFQHDLEHTGITPTTLGTNLAEKWFLQLDGKNTGEVWSSPIVWRGNVYVATDTGWVYAARADTGGSLRSVLLEPDLHFSLQGVLGTPCADGDRVYVGSRTGFVYALDAWTLEREWMFDLGTGEDPRGTHYISGSPVVYDGVVYVGEDTGGQPGYLHSIDIDTSAELCADQWDRRTQWAVTYSTPAVRSGRCYVSDLSCWVTAFGCSTGARIWEHSEDTAAMYSSPSVHAASGQIFVGSHFNRLYRLTDEGGDSGPWKWFSTGETGIHYVDSTAVVTDAAVYFTCLDGKVYRVSRSAFDDPTPTADWVTDLGSPITASPLLSGNVLFVATQDGRLRALDISNGSPAGDPSWAVDLPNGYHVRSSFAAADGRLYVVCSNGGERRLYCFGPPD